MHTISLPIYLSCTKLCIPYHPSSLHEHDIAFFSFFFIFGPDFLVSCFVSLRLPLPPLYTHCLVASVIEDKDVTTSRHQGRGLSGDSHNDEDDGADDSDKNFKTTTGGTVIGYFSSAMIQAGAMRAWIRWVLKRSFKNLLTA